MKIYDNEIEKLKQISQLQVDFVKHLLEVINHPDIFLHLSRELHKLVKFDIFNFAILNASLDVIIEATFIKLEDDSFRFIHLPDSFKILPPKREYFSKGSPSLFRLSSEKFLALIGSDSLYREIRNLNIRSVVFMALNPEESRKMILSLGSKSADAFSEEETMVLECLLPQIRLIIENYFSFEQCQQLRAQLENEKKASLKEWQFKFGKEDLVAESQQMKQVLYKVRQVAPTDSTVLLEGETGVGKELIAKAIHCSSSRNKGPLVMVNCAALPPNLIESELFGHEKGSFTGASERRIGKFELANGGTIFLDEIGDMPFELQAKLLRVLQEKDIERIGGTQTIHVDVRIVAASNRKLEEEIKAGRFRSDLYFRLNAFPIYIPPLRERVEDIPALIHYFIEYHGGVLGKPYLKISEMDMQKLMNYQWPGNVRELKHIIQKAVILTTGDILNFSDFKTSPSLFQVEKLKKTMKTLKEVEIEHILEALRLTNGKVSGEDGAARLLGINPKTLDSKIRKLGIKKVLDIQHPGTS